MANDSPLRLLVSVRPRFAREIMLGTKRVELRRVRPAVGPGDEIVIYETSPTCAVVCRAVVDEVLSGPVARLWRRVGSVSGMARSEFLAYYRGVENGFAIRLHGVESLDVPVSLHTLRRAGPGFAPPQSYHYLLAERARDRRFAACL